MNLQNDLVLRPNTLAWIEQAGGEVVLPVVWFGCVHGFPVRLVVGLRDESCLVGGEDRVRRFCLCWMRDSSAIAGQLEEKVNHGDIVRLGLQRWADRRGLWRFDLEWTIGKIDHRSAHFFCWTGRFLQVFGEFKPGGCLISTRL